ncbi:FMN-dependent alpha-hydroxy acid dehydrogenase family protein [Aspergillus affinis]|uniref:FMN-dependent alpha-hydroxy acid dehydrogenase family protein n=1 Tax=Aspergillus affinis TaxID=1070780 RepID=UPI0022FE2A2B|nr:uncharacterized protein KD926_010077 [Aspergillus affinis]KAI9038975.1 hypothetical protein KD926_010077 [Aspergillus affinis]
MEKRITLRELQQHVSYESCWVSLYGRVYDVCVSWLGCSLRANEVKITGFLDDHPGGSSILLNVAGKDATKEYDPIHPPSIMDEHLSSCCLGVLGCGTLASRDKAPESEPSRSAAGDSVSQALNLHEIETLARQKLPHKAWAYYLSATDDNLTKMWNNSVYQSILLRPRVFIDCSQCDLSTTVLGHQLGLPVYVSPAAMARLAHHSGEAGIANACAKFGALQIISHNASLDPVDIIRDAREDQVFGWQLYCLKDVRQSERRIQKINQIKRIKFIVLTLDAPFPGKREVEVRSKMDFSQPNSPPQVWGTDASLTWEKTLRWLHKQTDLPVVLKGVQTYEDAILAARYAPYIRGIILSNHGGRALDTASTPIHTLLEIHHHCPEVFTRLDVMIDGGIKRGTDIVKALALGAKAVGIGRAPLWGLAAGGPVGVERVLEILSEETATAMRLLGVSNVSQLSRQHINARALELGGFRSAPDTGERNGSRL